MIDFDAGVIRKRISRGYRYTIYKIKPIMDIARRIDSYNNKGEGKIKGIIETLLKNKV